MQVKGNSANKLETYIVVSATDTMRQGTWQRVEGVEEQGIVPS
jgi:hypothetical protein